MLNTKFTHNGGSWMTLFVSSILFLYLIFVVYYFVCNEPETPTLKTTYTEASGKPIISGAQVELAEVPNDILNEIKETIGIHNERDKTFFIRTSEITKSKLSEASKKFLEAVVNRHPGHDVKTISFQ